MKLFEMLGDYLLATNLVEMARDRSDAKRIVTEASDVAMEHLLKLFVFNSPENTSHWCTEIDAALVRIFRIKLKQNKKRPDWQNLYNWFVFDASQHYNEEWIDEFVSFSKYTDYKDVPLNEYDKEFVLNKILSIVKQVMMDISDGTFRTIRNYL